MGSGGPRGLQILPSGGSPVRGGFDSHTFPPQPALRLALLRALAVALALLALLAPRAGAAQPATETEGVISETAAAPADTAAVDSLVAPIEGAAAATSEVRPGFWSRPTGIMLRSLAIPGWGQATNGQWIKAGLAAAVEGALIAGIIADTAKLSDLAAEDPERTQLLDDRQAKWWWLGGALVLSMVDAYVSAHLRDFDIEAEPVASAGGTPGFAARLAFSFP